MTAAVTPQPGDFAVVSVHGTGGRLIHLAEDLNGSAFDAYQHAMVCVSLVGSIPGYPAEPSVGTVVEAEPHGARTRLLGSTWETPGQLTRWSTSHIPLTQVQRAAIVKAAIGYVGTPYSWLDYAAIAAHRLGLNVPGLRGYIAASGHQICSQLVDSAYADAGVHLFQDQRWPGFVTPADLAGLLEDT